MPDQNLPPEPWTRTMDQNPGSEPRIRTSDQLPGSSWFNEYRLQGKFCDAVVRVEDVDFRVHRVVLSDCSPYFSPFFEYESWEESRTTVLSGLSADTMQLILDFAYTGLVPVTEHNVEKLMLAADMLNITTVVQVCADFLCEQLVPENCVGIWQFSKVCVSGDLQRRSCRFLLDRFEDLVPSDEFLQLTLEELQDLLSRDELNVKNECTVFEAILRWVSQKPEEEDRNHTVLFPKFRAALTTMEYLNTCVMSSPLVQRNQRCRNLVTEALRVLQSRGSPGLGLFHLLARPRLPSTLLLAIGGCRGEQFLGGIEAYDASADCWVTVPNTLDPPRADHGTVFLDGYVYVVGGFNGEVFFISVTRLDLRSHRWEDVSPMYYCRGKVSVTVLRGFIYAMGGYDGFNQIRSAERYSPPTDSWSCIAPMCQWRSEASCTTLRDKIYISGGFEGQMLLRTAESYDPVWNQWTLISPMLKRRCEHGVVAHQGRVYAIGGSDGTWCFNSAEVYDPQTNTWTLASSMKTPRCKFGLGVIQGRIYAVGGRGRTGITSRVEFYDAALDDWFPACDVKRSCLNFSCCVVGGIPNMADYSYPRDAARHAQAAGRALPRQQPHAPVAPQ